MAKKPKKPDLSADVLLEPLVPAAVCPCGCGRPADSVDFNTGDPVSITCLLAQAKVWQDAHAKEVVVQKEAE